MGACGPAHFRDDDHTRQAALPPAVAAPSQAPTRRDTTAAWPTAVQAGWTSGTVAKFHNSNGSLRWTNTAKDTGTASWTPVYQIRPC
ncbi:hypothetical protein ACF061_15215 [Streptomyces sp. NPDC015220]|uniref:hypothetical protein n=1 Tax=Streptomyces sp. NPDC015220 TaxID=3364947 RepID=UPI0036F4FC2B